MRALLSPPLHLLHPPQEQTQDPQPSIPAPKPPFRQRSPSLAIPHHLGAGESPGLRARQLSLDFSAPGKCLWSDGLPEVRVPAGRSPAEADPASPPATSLCPSHPCTITQTPPAASPIQHPAHPSPPAAGGPTHTPKPPPSRCLNPIRSLFVVNLGLDKQLRAPSAKGKGPAEKDRVLRASSGQHNCPSSTI